MCPCGRSMLSQRQPVAYQPMPADGAAAYFSSEGPAAGDSGCSATCRTLLSS